MGVSRVGLWAVGFVSVRTVPLVRCLRDVLVSFYGSLWLGPIVGGWCWRGGVLFRSSVAFAIVVFFVLLLDVFLYARTDFCLSLVFFGNYYRWLVEIRGRYRYIGWFVTLWAGPSHS